MLTPPSLLLLVIDVIGHAFGRQRNRTPPLVSREVSESPLTAVAIMVGLVLAVIAVVLIARL